MKRILLILCALLGLGFSGVRGETYTITFNHSTGTFYKGATPSSGWVNKWVSNEEGKPVVTITASANNINTDNGRFAPGSSQSSTYVISVQDGYIVTGFSLNCPTFGADVTVTPAGEEAVTVATGGTLVVNSSASSFVYSGNNSGRIQASSEDGGSFIITVEDDLSYVDWTPSIEGAFVTVGEKVESFSPVTERTDNSKWYILTQVRDGESAMYDAGDGQQLRRGATSVTAASLSGKSATENAAYLIRFVAVGEGTYNIQFANGRWINRSLCSGNQANAGTYAFYNCNGGSGSYFGWNLDSKSGSRVDNNGATYNLSFWGSGEVTGNSGNNVWYMYETTVEAPSTTYTYEISDATGVVFTSESFSGTAGETISTLPSSLQLDYCNYTVTSTVIANGLGNTVPVTVTYNLPFTVSTDFENATWYYATIRGTKYLRADDNNKDDSGRYTTNSSNEHTDAYKWAFFGNPYTNFYVMNKGQGDGKYMAKQTQIVFRSLTDPTTDNTALWAVTPNSNGGFTLRNIDGGATWYVNDAGGFGNLGFWNSGSGANDAGSNWVITEVPTNPIDVTYELYVGGEKVNTVVDEQVAPNSAVSVPASLTANYSDFAYDIVTSGTIGEDDCTITVTATLKNGIVLPTALSNSKKYRLTTSTRGSLSTYTNEETTYLASPVKSALGISAKDFAIINYEGNYYLYSVDDAKFVTYQSAEIAPLAATVTGTSDAISFSQTTNSVYEIRFDNSASKVVNSSASYTYGIVVNSWGANSNEWDDGCQYVIYEIDDFDATDALAALEEKFHPAAEAQFNEAIAALEAINFGTGLNQYGFTGDYAGYTSQAATIISSLKAQGYTEENLAVVQALLANYALNTNVPAGFYRIKGKTNNKYLAAGSASNGKYNMSDATDNTTLFYFDGTKLMNVSSGLSNGVTANSWAWVTEDAASTVTFEDGETNGGYIIHTANAYFFDGGTSADRGGSYDSRAQYRSWYLEPFSGPLVVTVGPLGWATLCAPVALTIPDGMTVYYVSTLSEKEATLETITEIIPAATPVILNASENSYEFAFATEAGKDVSESNKLSGSIGGKAVTANQAYTLQRQNVENSTLVGLYPKTEGTIAGFKAYLPVSAFGGMNPAGVKGFTFTFDDLTTGINELDNSTIYNSTIYSLSGQRLSKPVKGINIVNGKKVLVK